MVRDHFGTLGLARHPDGAAEAMIVFDQQEDTRCEQAVAAHLVEATPALDKRVITADALHDSSTDGETQSPQKGCAVWLSWSRSPNKNIPTNLLLLRNAHLLVLSRSFRAYHSDSVENSLENPPPNRDRTTGAGLQSLT